VLQYTLTLRDPATGLSRDQVVTGVTHSNAAARLATIEPAEAGAAAGSRDDSLALQPHVYMPALGLLLQVFPYDHKLPGLRSALHGWPTLDAALLGELGPGKWEIVSRTSDTVRYRPTMRAMVRLELQARDAASGRTAVRRAYAKVYADDDAGERGRQVLQALWERTTGAETGFAVARPIIYEPEIRVLLQSERPGIRLLDFVRRSSAEAVEAAVRRAARAVAGLHQLSLPEGLLPRAPWHPQARLTSVTGALARKHPAYATAIEELAGAIAAAMGEPPLAPTHFDLKPGNILYDDGQISLIDFDKLALGDPLIDVANIVANLGSEQEGGRRKLPRHTALSGAFREEYFARVPPSWQELFPARYALATLGEADVGRGMRGRPERADRDARFAAAIARAHDILAGRI
jgi:hypothetical protein